MEKHLSLWWNATTDLAAGTYTVTDANGCIATTSVTIDAAPAITLTATHHKLCFGGKGSICLTSNGSTFHLWRCYY
jgi:hypothetical protein